MTQSALRTSSAEFLRAMLDASGLTDQELSRQMGTAPDIFRAWLHGAAEMTSRERLAARRTVREATRTRLEDITTTVLFTQIRRHLGEGDVIWAWKVLVQTCDWLARGNLPIANFTSPAPGILGVEWETLSAELLGRSAAAGGQDRPAWTVRHPLAARWEPLSGARRRGWDPGLLALNIAVDIHDLEIR